jgi:hypothetical protein
MYYVGGLPSALGTPLCPNVLEAYPPDLARPLVPRFGRYPMNQLGHPQEVGGCLGPLGVQGLRRSISGGLGHCPGRERSASGSDAEAEAAASASALAFLVGTDVVPYPR